MISSWRIYTVIYISSSFSFTLISHVCICLPMSSGIGGRKMKIAPFPKGYWLLLLVAMTILSPDKMLKGSRFSFQIHTLSGASHLEYLCICFIETSIKRMRLRKRNKFLKYSSIYKKDCLSPVQGKNLDIKKNLHKTPIVCVKIPFL